MRNFLLIASFVLLASCDKAPTKKTVAAPEAYDVYRFSQGSEPFLLLTRTAQFLESTQTTSWNLSYIKNASFDVFVLDGNKKKLLHGSKINPKDALVIFGTYAQKDENIKFYFLTNSSSLSVELPSYFTSAGRPRKEPIPNKSGTYPLFETYDGEGLIVLELKLSEQGAQPNP